MAIPKHVPKKSASLYGHFVLLATLFLTFHSSYGQMPVVNKHLILTEANKAYYNLREHGVIGFQATVLPDWRSNLEHDDPDSVVTDSVLHRFQNIHLSITFDSSGVCKVSKSIDQSLPELAREDAEEIRAYIETWLGGFFSMWKPMTFDKPFTDPDSAYEVTAIDGGYHTNRTDEDGAVVSCVMDKDYVIQEIKVSSGTENTLIKPAFVKVRGGWLVAGIDQMTSGDTSDADSTHLKIAIEYDTINGLELPSSVRMSGWFGIPYEMLFRFSDYHVVKEGDVKPQRSESGIEYRKL
jgi:hypothetical protein